MVSIESSSPAVPIGRFGGPWERWLRGWGLGGGLAGMTTSLHLAEQGYEVYLVEKGKELGGNLRESFYTLKGSNPQDLLSKLIKQVESNGSIHLYSEAEILGFEKKNGHYQTKIRHQNVGDSTLREEKILDHGALVLATGGKEIIPKEYLYGKDLRVITQRQLEKMIHLDDKGLKDLHSVVMIQCV